MYFNSRPSARGDDNRFDFSDCLFYFNSRPSARGDEAKRQGFPDTTAFQFTPLREGRPFCSFVRMMHFAFQFTPLREGRLCAGRHDMPVGEISIHAPPRGATMETGSRKRKRLISIHAPPRGATGWNYPSLCFCPISIHAPPRGATHPRGVYVLGIGISIHAPPRGATPRVDEKGATMRFQFTPLREGRRQSARKLKAMTRISIHAPPRGATDGK